MGEQSSANITHQVDDFYFSALSHGNETHDLIPITDESYAEELQLQEVLFSAVTGSAQPEYRAMTSTESQHAWIMQFLQDMMGIQIDQPMKMYNNNVARHTTSNLVFHEKGSSSSSQSQLFCKICMENVPADEVFQTSNACSHVFCRGCLTRYLATKIQENISVIKCPNENCKVVLEPGMCQELLPSEVFERWENALCESMLLGAQKLYCPFKDCSALIIDDGQEIVTRSECPSCRRLFCAACKVAWHTGLSCKGFGKIGEDERGKEELLMMQVAKEKKWRRCPSCKYFVEKREGCLHITCRCGFEFCYGCGNKWVSLMLAAALDECEISSYLPRDRECKSGYVL